MRCGDSVILNANLTLSVLFVHFFSKKIYNLKNTEGANF